MSADDIPPESLSLRRWSQRKFEAARAKNAPAASANPVAAPATVAAHTPVDIASPAAARAPVDVAPPAAAPVFAATLPPVESLTIDSDFTAFFQPKVGESLKRQALKQLFRDPRFNVMDGLDVYVGDYSIPDPISPDIVKQMVQGRYIFDPPATRINAQGHVEDVPPEGAVPGVPADPVADAAGKPALPSTQEGESASAPVQPSTQEAQSASAPVQPSTQEAQSASALVQPSTTEAESVPLPVAPSTAQATDWSKAPAAPSEIAAAATPLRAPGLPEPPPR